MLLALPSDVIKQVIKRDQDHKRDKIRKKIEKAKQKQKQKQNQHTNGTIQKELDALRQALRQNENRNFNADVVVTKTSNKFQFDKYTLEIAVKETTESHSAFTNKEFIGAAYYHFYSKGEAHLFKDRLKTSFKMV